MLLASNLINWLIEWSIIVQLKKLTKSTKSGSKRGMYRISTYQITNSYILIILYYIIMEDRSAIGTLQGEDDEKDTNTN